MDSPSGRKPNADLRDYLAEERAFLAWIRTGIALIGLGFVTTRLRLVAEAAGLTHASVLQNELALWFETALIAIGVVVNLVSARRHMRLVDPSNRVQVIHRFPSVEAVIVALLLALLGVVAICVILLPPQALAAFHA
jgi:putative membrane protein